jgi:hypothetical protein
MVNPGAAESFYLRQPLTSSEARRVANHLERGLNCRPTHLPSFQLLGQVLPVSEPWGEQDIRFLRLGLKHYPAEPELHFGLAALEWKSGSKDLARKRIQSLLDAQPPLSSQILRRVEALRDGWTAGEFESELDALIEAERFVAALALIDAQLARLPEHRSRRSWENRRRFIAADVTFDEVNDALRSQDVSRARALLEALIASDAPEASKRRAEASLGKLNAPAPRP